MKTAPNTHIYDLWNAGGPFVGDNGAPHGRVTVEIGWVLRQSGVATIGTYDRGPIRWFQRSNNSQAETEVPNIKTIDIDRSIDTDSATCKIVMVNQKMAPNGTIITGTAGESVGQPGYYYPTRGDSAASNTRWGWTTNEWNDVLQPNALIRTYQGYGGRTKTISQALTDGNITQTGVWLVDDVQMDAGTGNMTINCRDMVKLLIEQTLYPPLVPTVGSAHYPLSYYRWVFVNHQVIPYGSTVYKTGYVQIENDTPTVHASTSAGGGLNNPQLAMDGTDPDTYWLSTGHSSDSLPTDFEYFEVDLGGITINGFNIQCYAGNYEIFASVMVGGVWQNAGVPGNVIPTTNSGMNINFVTHVGVGWETADQFYLNGTYAGAQKLRITFTHLAKTSSGPAVYRCGIRDFNYGGYAATVTGGGRTVTGISRSSDSTHSAYWLAGSDGGVFTFGPGKFHGSAAKYPTNAAITGIAGDATGKGYRLCAADGGVFCFGNLPYKGSIPGEAIILTSPIVDIENNGVNGYYLLDALGQVYAFGDAVYHGNATITGPATAVDMARKPSGGYWIVDSTGAVFALGGASYYGGGAGADAVTAIEPTHTGLGYWIVDIKGAVYAYGDAIYRGGIPPSVTLNGAITDMAATGDDGGYWLVGDDGGVFVPTNGNPNNARFSGSLPQQYSRVADGNYLDYLDIIKDLLLWSGWWLWNPSLGDATPAQVFGNLETTGIYAPTNLTEDFFDKKPVIDVINTLKEITGYIAHADETGAYQYKAPNVFVAGNFLDTGLPTALIPSIDEKLQMTAYQLTVADKDARSQIIIATADPQVHFTDTKSVTITSTWGTDLLRGIVRPALWVNGQFLTTEIQTTMAHLVDLHLFLAQRQGTLTMPANPILQIDDQVRVFERSTSETYIHYLRGYTSNMDMETGSYTMSLQTHWLGDGTSGGSWGILYT